MKTIRVSGMPTGLFGCTACADKPADLPIEQAIREALRNAKCGYWIGGCGYEYSLRPEDILDVTAPANVPAILERQTENCNIQHGAPAMATATVIVRPVGEHRILHLQLAGYMD